MNLSDLLKRIDLEKDKDKMFIFRDKDSGWTNVNFKVEENEITVTLDTRLTFSDE